MEETFTKVNDYTLQVCQEEVTGSARSDSERGSRLTRVFNFLSQQITTTSREWIVANKSYNPQVAGHSAISGNTFVQSFADLPSTAELSLLHEKLIEMGGQPPSLDDVLKQIKKPQMPVNPGLKSSP